MMALNLLWDPNMSDGHVWIAYFDCEGFEAIIDVTANQQEAMLKKLTGDVYTQIPLEQMTMRARFNGHRSPEIWGFTADTEITEDALRHWADTNPQSFANWLRKNGTNIWGKPDPLKQRVVIT